MRVRSAEPASEEDARRFWEALQATAEETRQALAAGPPPMTAREARFQADLMRLWEEAVWIARTGQFPDGQPLRRQLRIFREAWAAFMGAIDRWQAKCLSRPA